MQPSVVKRRSFAERWTLWCWALIGLFVLLKMPAVNLPAYHDERYVVRAGWDVLHNRFFPFPKNEPTWGHPSLIFEPVAMAWCIVGPKLWAIHILSLGFSVGALLMTYTLGRELWGRRVGFVASAMLAFCPLFFAQAGILHLDLPADS